MPLAGRAAARHGSGPVTRVTLAATGVGVALPALAPDPGLLVVAAVASGAANGALDVVMNAQGVTVERRLGRPILSSLHAGFSFGGLAGAGLGALASAAGVDPHPSPGGDGCGGPGGRPDAHGSRVAAGRRRPRAAARVTAAPRALLPGP